MICPSLRLIWLITMLLTGLALLHAGVRLDACRKPGRSPFARFPNFLRREDYEEAGQRWYTRVVRLAIIAALVVGALAPIEFLFCDAMGRGATTQTLTVRGDFPGK